MVENIRCQAPSAGQGCLGRIGGAGPQHLCCKRAGVCRRLVQSVWNNANRGPFPDHHDSIAAGRSRRRKATASTRPPMDGQHRAQMPFFRACLLQSARGSACTLGTYIRPGGLRHPDSHGGGIDKSASKDINFQMQGPARPAGTYLGKYHVQCAPGTLYSINPSSPGRSR